MKNTVILSIAVLMLVRPLWPIAEYVMNYDYIANVLCENKDKPMLQCDGKCYLAELLAKESQQNEENPFGNFLIIEVSQIFYSKDFYSFDWNKTHYSSVKELIYYRQNLLSQLLVFEMVQPPEFL